MSEKWDVSENGQCVLSAKQYGEMFDRNMRRFVERMNYDPSNVMKYGAWSYTDGILADGSGRHYVQRLGDMIRNQDGESVTVDKIDYKALSESIRTGEFYNFGYRFVCIPFRKNDELVCFGLGESQ